MINVPDFRTRYNDDNWIIEQKISSFSTHDLCGNFEKAIKRLKSEQEYYEEYLIEPGRTVKTLHGNGYCEVKFDSITLETPFYESKDIEVWGTRKPTEQELKYLEANRLKDEEKLKRERKKQWQALKKEFGA